MGRVGEETGEPVRHFLFKRVHHEFFLPLKRRDRVNLSRALIWVLTFLLFSRFVKRESLRKQEESKREGKT